MAKYTMTISEEQEKQLDQLQIGLRCTTRAEVFRKALNLAVLVTDIIDKGQSLAVEKDGKIVEKIRLI